MSDLDKWACSMSHRDPNELTHQAHYERKKAEKRKARDRERKALQAAQRKALRIAGAQA